MTRKQFELLRQQIQRSRLIVDSSVDPMAYVLKRADANRQRLVQLLAAARTVKGSKTVQRKAAAWERQLKRLEILSTRLGPSRSV